MKKLLPFIFGFAIACGTQSTENNASNNGTTGNTGGSTTSTNNGQTTSNNGSTGTSGGGACEEVSQQFIDAVRAMPRACESDAGCKIVARAQVCDCDLAVTSSTETADYDAARAALDDSQCANPFGCADGCPYRKLSEPGELYARCNEDKECEVVQVMTCDAYEAAAKGGVVSPGACMDASGCAIRADLNPCGCAEAITTNFPLLAVQSIAEVMEINNARCSPVCDGCPTPGNAACGSDGAGNMVCQMQ